MKLSICIVNFNSGQLLSDCLDTIDFYPPACAYEVIVVDNKSSDGSQLSAATRPGVLFIQNKENAGFARANNQAFNCSQGEYLLMLNADTKIKPGALDRLLSCADLNPDAALISAKLVNLDGSPQIGFNVRRLPTLATAFSQLMLLDEVWPNNPITRDYMCLDLDYSKLQAIEQPAASALLYRRAAWKEIGGLDEQFSNWYNDVDLCKRIFTSGWKILFCPAAEIIHYGGMGVISRTARSSIIEAYRSQRLYYNKHFSKFTYGLVNAWVIIGMLLRMTALNFRPNLQDRVSTHAQKDSSQNTMRNAFQAVLKDTLRTWSRLPD